MGIYCECGSRYIGKKQSPPRRARVAHSAVRVHHGMAGGIINRRTQRGPLSRLPGCQKCCEDTRITSLCLLFDFLYLVYTEIGICNYRPIMRELLWSEEHRFCNQCYCGASDDNIIYVYCYYLFSVVLLLK